VTIDPCARSLRNTLTALSLCALIACGDTVEPSHPIPLREGITIVSIGGINLSPDPSRVCQPFGVPIQGTAVSAKVELAKQDRDEWIATGTDSTATVKMTLTGTGNSRFGGLEVTGTIRGELSDSGPFPGLGVRDVRFGTVGGATISLVGTVYGSGFTDGEMTGPVSFRDSAGATGTCPYATWSFASGNIP
jgi:hypothetical protein